VTFMRVALLSREYPPEIYGGAGVHVEYLGRELKKLLDLRVYCFGKERSGEEVKGAFDWWPALDGKATHLPALRTLAVNLQMSAALEGAQLVHTHTWYANFAGHLSKLLYGIPHVMTSHSLEPLRPWKEEQLGGGYRVSSFVERTAALSADRIIAVSAGMKADILKAYPQVDPDQVHVIYNGIDTSEYSPVDGRAALVAQGIDPDRPVAIFIGRITRQKGVVHLLEAAEKFAPEIQLLLCAGAPDTPEIAVEVEALVVELQKKRAGVVWVREMLPRSEMVKLLSASTVFVCPSIYEPFGIVNVEAMGCGIAVVASAVGGIPEVVVEGETGRLVHYVRDDSGTGAPLDREKFARDFADRVNEVATNPKEARAMGLAGRARAVEKFSWAKIAEETRDLYRGLLGG
jgi:alpha-maltose-1-phosphate synthase